jgi:enoyl-CoA hydratase/carnithine racemase
MERGAPDGGVRLRRGQHSGFVAEARGWGWGSLRVMTLASFEAHDAVAILTLDRPKVNALSGALIDDLAAAVETAASPAIRCVILTGAPHFAAGADITEFKAAMDAGGSAADVGIRLSAVCDLIEGLEKPVIAAVRGFALGGGLELAMSCDFRFFAEDARVGQPEIKLGIIPGAGGTQRLPRLVGLARARDLVFSGRMVEPDEALAIGLADRVVPVDSLLDEALASAVEWAAGPTRALGIAKRVMNRGLGLPLSEALALEGAGFVEAFETGDAVEGVDAFLEKRKARFTGE